MRAFATLSTLSMSIAALAAPVRRAASDNTVLALKFAHVLEQLETQFYAQALQKFQSADFTTAGFINPPLVADQLTIIAGDEATHTTVLAAALEAVGAQPITTCKFSFDSVLTDVKTTVNVARLVEHLGVSAYLGATTLVDDPQLLVDAATILTVESKHSTIHNLLAGGTSIASAFDLALNPSQVLAIAGGFISGCDLGIPANAPLTVTNTDPVVVGSKLQLSSPALNDTVLNSGMNITCQMMVGGAAASIAQPIDSCIVPDGIDGLVYVYVTMTNQPLLNDLAEQFSADVIAGPLGVFIDTKRDLLAELITNAPIGGNPAFVSSGGNGGSTPPSNSTPSDPAAGSPPSTTTSTDGGNTQTTTTAAPGSTPTGTDTLESTFTLTSTIAATEASSLLASISSASPSASGVPGNVAAQPTATPGGANLVTGNAGGANVLGWSSVPANALPTPSAARRSVPRVRALPRRAAPTQRL